MAERDEMRPIPDGGVFEVLDGGVDLHARGLRIPLDYRPSVPVRSPYGTPSEQVLVGVIGAFIVAGTIWLMAMATTLA